MKKYLMAALMLAVLCFLTSCGVDEAAWQEKYDLGAKYLEEYNYEEAVLAYSEAIKIDSKQPESFVGRGTAYAMIEDDYKKAIEDYEQALKLDDSCVEAYIGLSDVYLCKKDTEKAKSVLNKGYKATKNELLSERNEELDDLNAHIDLKFEHKDVSLYSDDGEKLVNFYYDLPYVSEEHLQGRKINADLRKKYEEYLKSVNELKKESETEGYFDAKWHSDIWFYTWAGNESYNKDGIISIYFEERWWMGGVCNIDPHGFNYDLRTGEKIQLENLFEADPESWLEYIKNTISREVIHIPEHDPQFYNEYKKENEINEKTIENYELSSFDFYFASDGELVICIPTYELGSGAEGAFKIHCGIYYNPPRDALSTSETDDETIFAAEFLGKSLKEARDYYGGCYYIDYYEGGRFLEFIADSPAFFIEVDDVKSYYDPAVEWYVNKWYVNNWEQIIESMMAVDDMPLLPGLTASMTYPEIVKAVGKEVALEEPDYWYNEIESEWVYTLGFEYKGYGFCYEWNKDPDTTKSVSVGVSKKEE